MAMATVTVPEVAPTCDARTGFYAASYGNEPVWCGTTVGLRAFRDRRNVVRRYCVHHESIVVSRFGKLGEACVMCGHTDMIEHGLFLLVSFEGMTVPLCDNCREKGGEE